jgi:hypothetical protein
MISLSEPNQVIYKFTKKISGSSLAPELPGKVSIEIKEDLDLEDLLETFENFLVACGFTLNESERVAIVSTIERDEDFSE